MKKMNAVDWIAFVLLVVGGINWGLIGIFNYNLVGSVGGDSMAVRVVYALVGLSAVYLVISAGSASSKKK